MANDSNDPIEDKIQDFKEHMKLTRAGKGRIKTSKISARHLELERKLSIKNNSQQADSIKFNSIESETISEHPLTGIELLAKLAELGNVSKSEQVRACGYSSKRKPGRLNFTGFDLALADALGKSLWKNKRRLTGQELSSKVEKLQGARKEHIVRSCGYVGKNKDGSEVLLYQEFYAALNSTNCKIKFNTISQANALESPSKETSLSESALEKLRQRQRASAQSRKGGAADSATVDGPKKILNGSQLVEFCVNEYDSKVAETSICIRAGYKTDNIGQFRRAFSKAADVPLAPLNRMIIDLKRKKKEKQRYLDEYLDGLAKSTNDRQESTGEHVNEELITRRKSVKVISSTHVRSTGFRNAVLKSHGHKCACCDIKASELLEAAHIVPVASSGTDHPSNGIALCPTHHSAFDRHYFTFEPGSRKLILRRGFDKSQLLITKDVVDSDVNDECLALRLRLFNAAAVV